MKEVVCVGSVGSVGSVVCVGSGVVGLWLYYRLGLGIGLELWSGCEGGYLKSVCGIVGESGCIGDVGDVGDVGGVGEDVKSVKSVKSVCDTGLVGGNGKKDVYKDVVRDIVGNVYKDVQYQVELGARYL